MNQSARLLPSLNNDMADPIYYPKVRGACGAFQTLKRFHYLSDSMATRVSVLSLILLLLPLSVWAVGTGNDLLPDVEYGDITVRLDPLASIDPSDVIDIAHAGDGSGRLFLVSPHGAIRIYASGVVLATPYLFLDSFIDQQGMSGLAFHPDYATNGKVYVISDAAVPNSSTPDYSAPQTNTATAFDNILFEFQVDPGDPNRIDLSTERELLRIHQSNQVHKMNDLEFGPDGYLYIAQGDGGDTRFGTPDNYNTNAQDTTLPHGAILRIDVDNLGPNGKYAIPKDNPFADGAGGNVPEIFCWGLRNPWRMTRDRMTGELYTGVNGDLTLEWVLRLENGKNYGWDTKEGSFFWNSTTGEATVDPSPDPQFTAPLAEYDHNWTTKGYGSIIGGYVYRGTEIPDLFGKYVFLDYVAAEMFAMDPTDGSLELVGVDPSGVPLRAFDDLTFGEDETGELYLGTDRGELLQVAFIEATSTPIPTPTPTPVVNGIAGHWRLDDATGTVALDATGYGADGALLNGPSWTSGQLAGGLLFDGSDDVVDLGNSHFHLSSELSILLWVYVNGDGPNTIQALFVRSPTIRPFRIELSGHSLVTGIRTIDDGTDLLSANTSLNWGQWYHVALTYSSGSRIIYIDGQADNSNSPTGNLFFSATDVSTLGARSTVPGDRPLNGILDDVRIYNVALSATEILDIYNGNEPPSPTPSSTRTPTSTPTHSRTSTLTPTSSPTDTGTPTPTPTLTYTSTTPPTPTPTQSPEPPPSSTPTQSPTETPTSTEAAFSVIGWFLFR